MVVGVACDRRHTSSPLELRSPTIVRPEPNDRQCLPLTTVGATRDTIVRRGFGEFSQVPPDCQILVQCCAFCCHHAIPAEPALAVRKGHSRANGCRLPYGDLQTIAYMLQLLFIHFFYAKRVPLIVPTREPEITWQLLSQPLQSHVVTMGFNCLPEFRELLAPIAAKVLSEPAPTSEAELQSLINQQSNATMMIGLVCHAGTMARTSPKAASKLLEIAKRVSETTSLDGDVYSATTAAMSEIATVCHQVLMEQ